MTLGCHCPACLDAQRRFIRAAAKLLADRLNNPAAGLAKRQPAAVTAPQDTRGAA